MTRRRLIVAMSGSSAPQLGRAVLRALHGIDDVETHLVLSEGARQTIKLEMRTDPAEVEALGDVVYRADDLAASISSGSFLTMGMVIVPCSMRTLGAVASGTASDLITRAADWCWSRERHRST